MPAPDHRQHGLSIDHGPGGHREVGQQQVCRRALDQPDQLVGVVGFADDVKSPLTLEQRANAQSDDRMIVRDDDARAHGGKSL